MKPSKRKRRIQAIKARLKEYYHLKEMNNYFKRNFIELTRHPADYSLFMDNKSIDRAIETLKSIMKNFWTTGTSSNCKVFLTSSLYLIINLNKGNYGFTSNI